MLKNPKFEKKFTTICLNTQNNFQISVTFDEKSQIFK